MNVKMQEFMGAALVILVLIGLPIAVFSYQFSRESGSAASLRLSTLPSPGDPAVGRRVYLEKCASCHGKDAKGGFGPDLRGAGILGSSYLYGIILDPKNGIALVGTEPKMPGISLSTEELADLVAYIISVENTSALQKKAEEAIRRQGADIETSGRANADLEKGRSLYLAQGCAACHGADGKGTTVGPSIIGKTVEGLRRQVRKPQGSMPAYGPDRLSDEDLEEIIRYIESLGAESGNGN